MSRVDVVVFPNGGHEIIGQANVTDLQARVPEIRDYVASFPAPPVPVRLTGLYEGGEPITFGDWLGELPEPEAVNSPFAAPFAPEAFPLESIQPTNPSEA